MTRIQALFAAGTLTALVLLTLLALGLQGRPVLGANETLTMPLPTQEEAGVQEILEQNRALREALQTMQARELEYQQQIESANRAILQLQEQQLSFAPTRGDSGYEDEEHEEHEEHEDDD